VACRRLYLSWDGRFSSRRTRPGD